MLTYLILIPLIGSILVLFIKKEQVNLIKYFVVGLSTLAFLLSLVIYFQFDSNNPEFQFINKLEWIKGLNIHYHVGVDGMSLLLVLLTTFLTPLTLISSWSSIKDKVKEFTFFFLMLEVGMLGVFISLDLFLFYIFL